MAAGGPVRGTTGESNPPHTRLKKRPDFLRVQQSGRRVPGRYFVLIADPAVTKGGHAAIATSRIGITVTKKVGGAVVRNRVKRWVRECVRQRRDSVPRALDLVVVARPEAADAGFARTCEDLVRLFARLNAGKRS